MAAMSLGKPQDVYASVISQNEIVVEETVSENTAIEMQEEASDYGDGVEGFVTRLYDVCLGRKPDASGKAYWMDELSSGRQSGAQVAYGFLFSEEFKNKNYCKECFVDSLYNCFMGRDADAEGKTYWLDKMNNGMTRGGVFNGFYGSQEFANICKDYGIQVGSGDYTDALFVITDDCGKCGADNKTVVDFVTRLYKVCLDREPDAEGLAYWVNELKNGQSGTYVAHGFIFSPEFVNKNYCHNCIVKYYYKAFFNRVPIGSAQDNEEYWQKKIAGDGETKGQVFNGFSNSAEFRNLCASYGVNQGKINYSSEDYWPNTYCPDCDLFWFPSKTFGFGVWNYRHRNADDSLKGTLIHWEYTETWLTLDVNRVLQPCGNEFDGFYDIYYGTFYNYHPKLNEEGRIAYAPPGAVSMDELQWDPSDEFYYTIWHMSQFNNVIAWFIVNDQLPSPGSVRTMGSSEGLKTQLNFYDDYVVATYPDGSRQTLYYADVDLRWEIVEKQRMDADFENLELHYKAWKEYRDNPKRINYQF